MDMTTPSAHHPHIPPTVTSEGDDGLPVDPYSRPAFAGSLGNKTGMGVALKDVRHQTTAMLHTIKM